MFIFIYIFLNMYNLTPCATTARSAQLGERRSADREVVGSKSDQTNIQGL